MQDLNLPIKLTIVLTKKPISENIPSEMETPLKLYKPGDIVTGYMLVENIGKDPIPFEMFLVSLEGTATIKSNDRKKLTRTRFLKMCDICASFHYEYIDVGPTKDRCCELCTETGAQYGLPMDKILKPGEKRKKILLFKIPFTLLDSVCEHQSPEHLVLPSSFGVDIESFNGEADKIQIGKTSGYGDLGFIGSPIRTNDLSSYGQSISYSINIRIIGKPMDFCKKFYTHSKNHSSDFILVKHAQHFFRVSTAGAVHNHNSDSAWYFKSNFSSDEQMQQLEKLFADTTEKLQLKRDLIGAGVTDLSEQQAIINDFSTTTKKVSQLADTRYNPVKPRDKSIVINVTAATLIKGLFNRTEAGELNITLSTSKRNSIDSIVPEVLKKLSITDSDTKSADVNHFYAGRPNRNNSPFSKSYGSVPLSNTKSSNSSFKSTNSSSTNTIFSSTKISLFRSSKSMKQNIHSDNSKSLSSSGIGSKKESAKTVPFSTSISPSLLNSSVVPLKGRSASHEFKIELTFNPNLHSTSAQPPTNTKIKPRLQVITIQSEKPIPITIDGQFLMESSALETSRNKFESLKYRLLRKYLMKWTELSKQCDGKLNVPKNVHDDLLALVRMQLRFPCGANGGLDMFETVECNDLRWSKDKESDVYHAELTFKLFLDEEKLKRTTGDANFAAGLVHLIPSFQTCLLGRFYAVRFEFEYGFEEGRYGVKDGKKVFASLPIDVV
ncbi:unnamed protein product [Ambrosiozyma monospora]|uniref:Unnamed protein product n=1 Tax=Ambrosiozyma monospora TaxID=43982 RepID=A0ACB5T2X1_AMBMO|nr:unnamed protein product [Ambrosiozyma monospora]